MILYMLVMLLVAAGGGVVSGVVKDELGGALAGVTAELSADPSAGDPRRVVTGPAGRYEFANVPAGRYRVTFSARNFATLQRTNVRVTAGAVTDVPITMRIALCAEGVVTSARTFRNPADVDHPEDSLVGVANAASEGAVTAKQIQSRAIMRAGEILETVPGVVISQHSGEGKANQYYLRGFNLDHGTDFSTTVAGVPVNLPTHAHGQGYSDANFLIPELVSGVQFHKGPYFADQGDFSSAGAANVHYLNMLERPIVSVGMGQDGWQRFFGAVSPKVGAGHLLVGAEIGANDGPWVRPDDYRKLNTIARYGRGTTQNAFSITGQLYRAAWNATDQVPRRAIDGGLIGRFGTLDDTGGGTTARYSVATELQRTTSSTATRVTGYAFRYQLNLFSNFTYALDDAVHGDQFEQADRRTVSGLVASQHRFGRWGDRHVDTSYGINLRYDHIPTVGLYRTTARTRVSTVREDAVRQMSAGTFVQSAIEWTPWLRTSMSLRTDGYRFAVDADDARNSGTERAGLVSPKGGVAFGPWHLTELYVNGGFGYHSNDARGATISRDPVSGDDAFRVTPLVRAKGAEVGLRTIRVPRSQMTVALWRLDLASELVFVGDAGTTEAGRPSHRHGLEVTTYSRITPWLVADADISWSRARFTDDEPAGALIPGALQRVISAGVTIESRRPWFGSVRVRHFGPRQLLEDGSVASRATSLVNAQIGYRFSTRLHAVADIFNVANATVSDIDYYYVSRLPGEAPGGVADVHSHPATPRAVRLGLQVKF